MSRSKKTDEKLTDLSRSGVHFTLDIYKHHVASESGNVFFSPFSLSVALAMTFAGAKNETAVQMRDAMKWSLIGEDSDIHSSFAVLLPTLLKTEDTGITLRTANRMYVHSKANVIPEYQQTIEDQYGSTTAVVDFATNADNVREEINTWVEEITNDKIKSLIAKGVLNALTRLVLVNAVYFKGNWATKFNRSQTASRIFHTSSDGEVSVDMMHMISDFPLGRSNDLKCRVLELPYRGKSLSMFILLPDARDGLADVEAKLSQETLKELLSSRHSSEVEISLPKFKLERSLQVIDLLQKMGMKDLFTEGKADLSGITGTNNLFVSDVIHKAFCEVNEKGSKAAAASAVVSDFIIDCGPPTFSADHPFLFFIQENSTGFIMFFGRVDNPNEK